MTTVTTQQALDDAIAAGYEDIAIDSPRGVWVTVRASGSATVRAYGSATVRAYGSATVTAYDSATVHATPKVAVHLHSGCCAIAGGVLIDHTSCGLTDPQTWCDYHGVPTEPEPDPRVDLLEGVCLREGVVLTRSDAALLLSIADAAAPTNP